MRLEVISISNKLTKWEDETLNFYLKQISSFANITINNIKPAQGRNLNIREVQTNEEKRQNAILAGGRYDKLINMILFSFLLLVSIPSAVSTYSFAACFAKKLSLTCAPTNV